MKIHPSIQAFKFCPNCGNGKTLESLPKKIICSSCQFCFYFNPAAAVAVILENNNAEFLVLERNQNPGKGLLDLPGGFVDPFETAQDAAIREIKEELNVCITKLTFLTSAVNLYTFKGVTYQTVDIGFHTKISDKSIQLNHENSSFYWLKADALKKKTYAFPSITAIINKFLEQNI